MNVLAKRSLSAIVLLLVSGLSLIQGGIAFQAFIALLAIATFTEFRQLVVKIIPQFSLKQAIFLMAGAIYITPTVFSMIILREQSNGLYLCLLAVLLVIAADLGGYGFGRMFGGKKLAPTISPNKTWSGLGGAVTLGSIVGYFLWSADSMGLFFGALIALIAQMGDLIESTLKRKANVKDSGTLIPGHGGVFDRIDGYLTAIPAFYGVQLWMGI